MNARTALIVAVLSLVLGVAAWQLGKSGNAVSTNSPLVFAKLKNEVNQIHQIALSDAENNQVTLVRQEDQWRLSEVLGYPADIAKIRELILAVSNATTLEQKTSNPEYYSRLGVQDVKTPSSQAIFLTLASEQDEYELLIGRSDQRGGGSSYVRKPSDAQSLLVTPTLDVSTVPIEWLDTLVLDILGEELQSIRLLRDDKVVEIAKSNRFGSVFELDGAEQVTPLDQASLNQLSGAIASLNFVNVQKATTLVAKEVVTARFTLFDGIVIDAKYHVIDGENESDAQYWLVASARFEPEVAKQFTPQPSSSGDALPAEFSLTEADISDRQERTELINQRINGWAYQLSSAQFTKVDQDKQSLIAAE